MIADVAHLLSTPITDIMEWEVADLVLWHNEAARIAKQRGL